MAEDLVGDLLVIDRVVHEQVFAEDSECLTLNPPAGVSQLADQTGEEVARQLRIFRPDQGSDHLDMDVDCALSDRGNLVLDENEGDGGQKIFDFLRREEWYQETELVSKLLPEPPVPVVVHLEELGQPGQVLASPLRFQHSKEVG